MNQSATPGAVLTPESLRKAVDTLKKNVVDYGATIAIPVGDMSDAYHDAVKAREERIARDSTPLAGAAWPYPGKPADTVVDWLSPTPTPDPALVPRHPITAHDPLGQGIVPHTLTPVIP